MAEPAQPEPQDAKAPELYALSAAANQRLWLTVESISDEFEECDIESPDAVERAIVSAGDRMLVAGSAHPGLVHHLVKAVAEYMPGLSDLGGGLSHAQRERIADMLATKRRLMRNVIYGLHAENRGLALELSRLTEDYRKRAWTDCPDPRDPDCHDPDLARELLFKYADALKKVERRVSIEPSSVG